LSSLFSAIFQLAQQQWRILLPFEVAKHQQVKNNGNGGVILFGQIVQYDGAVSPILCAWRHYIVQWRMGAVDGGHNAGH